MRCNPVGDAIEVVTPFTFADGDGIELFAQDYESQILFFDDGLTLFHLHNAGVRLGKHRTRWQPLISIAEKYAVTLSDDGVFETLAPATNPSHGFARIMSTLLGVAAWEREQVGVAVDESILIDEVAMNLQAWKPQEKIIRNPTVKGFSGRTLKFDFEMMGEYIEAIQPHSASTGATLRKIIDLNSAAVNVRKPALVIVDDRVNQSTAKQEIDIIGRVARTWPMTALMAASGATQARQ